MYACANFVKMFIKGENMYSRVTNKWLKHWDFILVDLLSLELSFLVAYIIRHGFSNPFIAPLYRSEAIILLASQLIAILFVNAFSGVLRRGYYIEFRETIKHVVVVMLVALAILFATKETGTYSRIVFVITGVLYTVVSYFARLLLKYLVKKTSANANAASLVVVTVEDIVQETIADLKKELYQQYQIKGICLLDKEEGISEQDGYRVISGGDKLIEYVCREWVDEVLFLLPENTKRPEELLNTLSLMGVTTHVPIVERSVKGSKQSIGKVGGYTVLTSSISIVDTHHMAYKRILDIVGGIVGCLLTLVLVVVVGPMIYFKSPGPIFFSQTRIGKNGRKFKIYKFRSMYMDAEERKKDFMAQNKMSGFMFKLDYDPRIIGCEKIGKDGKPKGIGNFIRSTSIDEFPQFWNVLKGDMSLVGTRPPTVDEWEQYEPHHRARMSIKPGITGMWQVSGRSDITDFEEVVKLDTEYIENWNLGLDIKILFMTVLHVLKNDGAV